MENKSPRKLKYTADVASKEAFAFFTERYPDIIPNKVQHNMVLERYFNLAAEHILKAGVWEIPKNLGRIGIIKFKTKVSKMPVDWAKTKQYKKLIYHTNDHSLGYRMNHKWKQPKGIYGIGKYQYIPLRARARELAKIIKEGKCDFPQSLI